MQGFNHCLNCGNNFNMLSGNGLDICPECERVDEENWMIKDDEEYIEPSHLTSSIEDSDPDDFESEDYMDYSIYGSTYDKYDFEN